MRQLKKLKEAKGLQYFFGLMFQKPDSSPIFWTFKHSVYFGLHSFFCPIFIALWYDENHNLIDQKLITPWKLFIYPKTKFTTLVEIPINNQKEVKEIWYSEKEKRPRKKQKGQ